ncbi:MAG: saccharopine dehydrogenase NADP-binding domain-containing protein [Cyclobacteriaceae bacterium]
MKNLLIYGSYGYTGRLIVEQCIERGIKPIIAGRNGAKVKDQASKHGLEFDVFDVNQSERLRAFLEKGEVVIHCGGPFIHTSKQMIEGCLSTDTHYLDITGEYEVFDLAKTYSDQAQSKNLMLLPGAGFDVVPSDCLAAMLKDALPDATHLELAFVSKGGKLSRGTTKTMIENLGQGQAFRKNGEYAFAKMGETTRLVDFGDFEQTCMAISWGDISTAFHSTGIPNIKVYAGTNPQQISQVRRANKLGWFLKLRPVKNFMKKQVDKKPDGPTDEKRLNSSTHLWGQVSNGSQSIEKRLVVPNGYTLTADTAVGIAQKVLENNFKSGFQTPSTAYGKDLILEFDQTSLS